MARDTDGELLFAKPERLPGMERHVAFDATAAAVQRTLDGIQPPMV